MPSASPSPAKQPSMTERNSSTHSLSSSGKQTSTVHKAHRPHVVGRHSRNLSHGKNLSKLNKTHSSANVNDPKNHQRKRSGASGGTPAQSPRSPGLPKRNSSHVSLPKNTSHGNLRKNHSATVLGRNTSQTALKKLGLAPTPQPKKEKQKTGFFELGDASSGEEEEGEWEDSTTQSPELTRNNSKASTPARVATPNGERLPLRPPDQSTLRQERTSSPPAPALTEINRSLPNFKKESNISPSQLPHDPALLHQNGRSSRAPPAMSTVSAVAGPSGIQRNESNRSFTHIEHSDAASHEATPNSLREGAASSERPVSHFINMTPASTDSRMIEDGSDEDSVQFMSNYKPQPSKSPEKSRAPKRSNFASIPSRTQQNLELQRRETTRAVGGPTTPPLTNMGYPVASMLSLHNRSGSRGRNTSLAEEMKAQKVDYETGLKQLTVVRRFRNPISEGLTRMKASGALPADIGVVSPSSAKSRPQSRRGINSTTATGPAKSGVSRSLEDNKSSPLASKSTNRGQDGRVRFQRQGSHDDIGITPSQESPDGGDEEIGMSPEEALMRRIWNSREVYDSGESAMVR